MQTRLSDGRVGGVDDGRGECAESRRHRFCRACLGCHVQLAAREKVFPVRCPQPDCTGSGVTVPEGLSLLEGPEDREKLERLEVESSLPAHLKFYCPNPACSMLMLLDEEELAENAHANCPSCRQQLCMRCRVAWHTGLTCAQQRVMSAQADGDAALLGVAGERGWKPCPQCRQMVELAHGINHITCKCGAEWCYKCGASWRKPAADAAGPSTGHSQPTCRCPLGNGDNHGRLRHGNAGGYDLEWRNADDMLRDAVSDLISGGIIAPGGTTAAGAAAATVGDAGSGSAGMPVPPGAGAGATFPAPSASAAPARAGPPHRASTAPGQAVGVVLAAAAAPAGQRPVLHQTRHEADLAVLGAAPADENTGTGFVPNGQRFRNTATRGDPGGAVGSHGMGSSSSLGNGGYPELRVPVLGIPHRNGGNSHGDDSERSGGPRPLEGAGQAAAAAAPGPGAAGVGERIQPQHADGQWQGVAAGAGGTQVVSTAVPEVTEGEAAGGGARGALAAGLPARSPPPSPNAAAADAAAREVAAAEAAAPLQPAAAPVAAARKAATRSTGRNKAGAAKGREPEGKAQEDFPPAYRTRGRRAAVRHNRGSGYMTSGWGAVARTPSQPGAGGEDVTETHGLEEAERMAAEALGALRYRAEAAGAAAAPAAAPAPAAQQPDAEKLRLLQELKNALEQALERRDVAGGLAKIDELTARLHARAN
ncbi:hypothetical protein GPECTOR_15g472 [Gonium pectorale]|uniref:RBR-type E3 ubiquitin transferase n=1 Tax=Gonium pectorale TaxID=33097 RepID=A0A150GLW1_GONPE|nr:hypothetical protein GPECTOR_15g472 [Gonium pectorale]|eukprot:KXZ50787.1 hypothetical protein GPECTOR_15g472 [Gonium pectorale]